MIDAANLAMQFEIVGIWIEILGFLFDILGIFDIYNECLPRKRAPLSNKRRPLKTQNSMSAPGAHSSKYGTYFFARYFLTRINYLFLS